jgi:hypothetical protein
MEFIRAVKVLWVKAKADIVIMKLIHSAASNINA